MPNIVFTFGHSTTPFPEAVRFLRSAGITLLVDVRSHPGSRRYPQWDLPQLQVQSPALGLPYLWAPGLGGWADRHQEFADQYAGWGVDVRAYAGPFPKQHITKKRPAAPLFEGPAWDNLGLYDYSWFMTLDQFRSASDTLVELASTNLVAIMCAETKWWCCHRSMIADYLVYRGHQVVHLQPKLTDHLLHAADRLNRYHPEIRRTWASWELSASRCQEVTGA